jgi:ferredoxin
VSKQETQPIAELRFGRRGKTRSEYIKTGQRVLSTECSLCQTCVTVCAKDALKLSFGFDLGGKDLLRERMA